MRTSFFAAALAGAAVVASVTVGSPAQATTFRMQDNGCDTHTWGRPTDKPVRGNWTGDSLRWDDLGLFRAGTFILGDSACYPGTLTSFAFGRSTDEPLAGDWNADGVDTIGVRRSNTFLLRDDNSAGSANRTIVFGRATDRAVVGDWDGDGSDDVGVQRGNVFYLRTGDGRVLTTAIGRSTDLPAAGDWDGDGVDTVALKRGSTWFLTADNRTVSRTVGYGLPDDKPFPGVFNYSFDPVTDGLATYR